jgi:DegT/DnrJ/EryC1/StrS aminotransferase family
VAAIELAGARPLLIDIDDCAFALDPEELGQVLAHPPGRIAAIIAVHLYGQAADMQAIVPLARRHGVPVIEYCAQSHGAMLGPKRLGSLGEMAAFSFYPTKNLGAIGDAGAILLEDPRLHERLRAYRQYGWSAARVNQSIGACSRLDELQAARLRVKLAQLERDNARRRQIAALYQQQLAPLPLFLPWPRPDALPVFHQYVVRSSQRDALRAGLDRRGVNTNIHYPVPVHLQPAGRSMQVQRRARLRPGAGIQCCARLAAGALGVETPGTSAGYRQKQKDEAVQDRLLAAVERRGEEVALRRVCHEVRSRHFSGQNECRGPGKQAKQYQRAAHDLEHPGKANERQRGQRVEFRNMRQVQQLGRPVLQE